MAQNEGNRGRGISRTVHTQCAISKRVLKTTGALYPNPNHTPGIITVDRICPSTLDHLNPESRQSIHTAQRQVAKQLGKPLSNSPLKENDRLVVKWESKNTGGVGGYQGSLDLVKPSTAHPPHWKKEQISHNHNPR